MRTNKLNLKARLDTDLEALEVVNRSEASFSIFTEVEEAYAQAGATRQTVVLK